jgi:hypothetical protein
MLRTQRACHDLYIRHAFLFFCKKCLNIIHFITALHIYDRCGKSAFQLTNILIVLSVRMHGAVPPFSNIPVWRE